MAVPVWTWIVAVDLTTLLMPVSANRSRGLWSSSHSRPCSLTSVLGAMPMMENVLLSAPSMVQDSPSCRMRAVVASSAIQTGASL